MTQIVESDSEFTDPRIEDNVNSARISLLLNHDSALFCHSRSYKLLRELSTVTNDRSGHPSYGSVASEGGKGPLKSRATSDSSLLVAFRSCQSLVIVGLVKLGFDDAEVLSSAQWRMLCLASSYPQTTMPLAII